MVKTPSTWLRYLVITLSGVLGMVALSIPGRQLLRRYNDWQETTCTIEKVAVVREKDSEGDTHTHADVTFRVHTLDQRTVITRERDPRKAGETSTAAQRLQPLQTTPCRYDPADPTQASLDARAFPWGLLLAWLVPLSWALIGAGGVVVRSPRGRFSAAAVPRELAHRLDATVPRDKDEGLDSWSGVIFGLCWNGFLTPFLLLVPQALPCLSLHLLAGATFTWSWLKPVLQRLRLGDTVLELSSERLAPGSSFDVKVIQTGASAVDLMTVRLVCEEVTTFVDGTNSTTERTEVFGLDLGSAAYTRVERAHPLVIRGQGQVPPAAMTSFRSTHNAVEWSILVQLVAPATPKREDRFPIDMLARVA